MRRLFLFFICLFSLTVPTTFAQTMRTCPTPANNPALDMSIDFFDFGQEIEAFLSNGGSTSTLLEAMRSRLIMSVPYAKRGGGQTLVGVWTADVNGDTLEDVVVNLRGGDEDHARATIWVYFCEGSAYYLAAEITFDAERGWFSEVNKVTYVQDLTGDGGAELVYHSTVCAPRLCDNLLSVVRWDDETQTLERLSFNPVVYNYDEYTVEDSDGDELYEIVRSGGLMIDDEPNGWRSLYSLPDVVYEWDGDEFGQVP